MNKLSKIAPIIVILAAAGSLFLGFKLDQMKKSHLAKIASLNDSLNTTTDKLHKTEATLRDTQKTLASTQADLATATTNLQTTTTALEQKTQEAEGLKTQVAERDQQLQATKTELAAAKGVIEKVQESLKAVGIENVQSIEDIRQRIMSLGEENKALSEQLRKMRDDNEQLQEKVVELSTTPVNLRGRVADVQDRWNFLVLNIGQEQQVRKHAQFLIYRGNRRVAMVQVVSVGPTTSVAEILPAYRRATPRVGDVAVH